MTAETSCDILCVGFGPFGLNGGVSLSDACRFQFKAKKIKNASNTTMYIDQVLREVKK